MLDMLDVQFPSARQHVSTTQHQATHIEAPEFRIAMGENTGHVPHITAPRIT